MRISVCMAAYNGEKYILAQIQSILKQLNKDDEIIIVDDASTDNTSEIINQIDDKRLKLYINKQNIGFVKSFEKAMQYAQNEIIFLSDQDDIWDDNKVRLVLNEFKSDEEISCVIHNAKVIDENGVLLKEKRFTRTLSKNIFIRNFISHHYTGCMMAFKNDFSANLYPFPKCVESHDKWIGLNLDLLGKKIIFLDKTLMCWIRHGKNASSIKTRSVHQAIMSRIKTCILILIFYFRKFLRKL